MTKNLKEQKRAFAKGFILYWENAYNLLGAFANEGNLYLYYYLGTIVQLIFNLQVPKIFTLWSYFKRILHSLRTFSNLLEGSKRF